MFIGHTNDCIQLLTSIIIALSSLFSINSGRLPRMRINLYTSAANQHLPAAAPGVKLFFMAVLAEGLAEKRIPSLNVFEFCDFLSTRFDEVVTESFRMNKIGGHCFMKLSEQQMGRIVTAIGDVVELLDLQSRVIKLLNPLSEQVSHLLHTLQ